MTAQEHKEYRLSGELLTARQREMLVAIETFTLKHGYSPSYRQLGKTLGITSPNGVRVNILALVRKGAIKRDPAVGRSIVVLKPTPQPAPKPGKRK